LSKEQALIFKQWLLDNEIVVHHHNSKCPIEQWVSAIYKRMEVEDVNINHKLRGDILRGVCYCCPFKECVG